MITSATRLTATALLGGALLSIAGPASATLKTCYATVSGVGRGSTAAIAFNKAPHKLAHPHGGCVWQLLCCLVQRGEPREELQRGERDLLLPVHAEPCRAGSRS
jgi:hypothetical protein